MIVREVISLIPFLTSCAFSSTQAVNFAREITENSTTSTSSIDKLVISSSEEDLA